MKRIAWIAPMDKKSAMSRDSHDICNGLSRFYDIDIWTPSEENFYETNFKINKISDAEYNLDIFNNYDYLVYNFGNNVIFHKKSYELFIKKPGIVILHDQMMYGFFCVYLLKEYGEKNFINSCIRFASNYYNQEEIKRLIEVLEGKVSLEYNEYSLDIFNMLLPIINLSIGIYSHASFFVDKLRENFSKPIGYSYLTCEREIKENNSKIYEFIPKDDRITLVSTGFINQNKRIDKIIDVLVNDKALAKKIKYVIIGDNSDVCAKKMMELSENELKDTLYMLGYQPEEVMESAIYNADLCMNLRYPNSEVCSLSVLEQMIHGKPVCVTNKGFFKELPDDSVIKVSLDNEAEDIKKVLNNIISDRNFYKDIGKNALRFVQNNCKIATYVEKFIDFLNECDKYDYTEDGYINNFIESVAEKYHDLGITKENGKAYIDIAIERLNNIVNK